MLGVVGNEIEALLNEEPTFQEPVRRLTALPGVDEKTAAILISEIGDIDRFPTQKHFLQYVGCAPTIYQSGTVNRAGHLNKRVNHFAKRAFFNIGKVICSLVKQDSDLKDYGRKQLNRHWGNKKQAWVKTGIKAARIVHHMLKTGDEYDPFYENQKEPQSLSHSSVTSSSKSPAALTLGIDTESSVPSKVANNLVIAPPAPVIAEVSAEVNPDVRSDVSPEIDTIWIPHRSYIRYLYGNLP